mmetsp:Transcript_10365/g.20893  ORF Transcript_10365/g.20893 Transcript_10365/m.20893 type:complete len:336 (-) Transcript_10365:131-1138(-)
MDLKGWLMPTWFVNRLNSVVKGGLEKKLLVYGGEGTTTVPNKEYQSRWRRMVIVRNEVEKEAQVLEVYVRCYGEVFAVVGLDLLGDALPVGSIVEVKEQYDSILRDIALIERLVRRDEKLWNKARRDRLRVERMELRKAGRSDDRLVAAHEASVVSQVTFDVAIKRTLRRMYNVDQKHSVVLNQGPVHPEAGVGSFVGLARRQFNDFVDWVEESTAQRTSNVRYSSDGSHGDPTALSSGAPEIANKKKVQKVPSTSLRRTRSSRASRKGPQPRPPPVNEVDMERRRAEELQSRLTGSQLKVPQTTPNLRRAHTFNSASPSSRASNDVRAILVAKS